MPANERDQPASSSIRPSNDPLAALDPAYLRVIVEAERRNENAPGADKSWVMQMDSAYRRHYDRPRQS